MAATLLAHHRQNCTRQVDDTEQVGLDLRTKVIRSHLLERRGMAITRIVDQHIEAAKGIERKLHRLLRGLLVGDVQGDDPHLLLAVLRHQIVQAPWVTGASDQNIAVAQYCFTDGATQATGRTGYKPDFGHDSTPSPMHMSD